MTLQELAAETGLTVKTLRGYIRDGRLRATPLVKGRMQRTFDVAREQADTWLAWREHRKVTRVLPSVIQRAARLQAEKLAYFPNDDVVAMNFDVLATRDALKQAALDGDVDARLKLKLPWEQGGMQVVSWWNREAGTII